MEIEEHYHEVMHMLEAVLLHIFVRDTRIAIVGADDRMITRPELEGDDVTG